MSNYVSIVGVSIQLIPFQRSELKGLSTDLLLRFSYYYATFNDQLLCIIRAKNRDESITPMQYKRITKQVETVVEMPVSVLLEFITYYERERLINQGVYFIISDKYAFLPSLIVNTRARKMKKSAKLIPAAQYLLLYHLLTGKVEFTLKELVEIMPYNYVALARAVTNLEDSKLCFTKADNTRTKYIHFDDSRRGLWDKIEKYLSSPVKKIVYCDSVPKGDFSISGVNALSQYSHLNAEQYGSLAIWERYFSFKNDTYNELDGLYKIEIWKYPTSIPFNQNVKVVDKLSLYLTMREDPDPRIEKELEIMIEEITW
jgi:hypothetical protein